MCKISNEQAVIFLLISLRKCSDNFPLSASCSDILKLFIAVASDRDFLN